jgi:hypothetical protein
MNIFKNKETETIERLQNSLKEALQEIELLKNSRVQEESFLKSEEKHSPLNQHRIDTIKTADFKDYLKSRVGKTIYFKYFVESKNKVDKTFRKKKLIYYNDRIFNVQKRRGAPVSTYRIDKVIDFK